MKKIVIVMLVFASLFSGCSVKKPLEEQLAVTLNDALAIKLDSVQFSESFSGLEKSGDEMFVIVRTHVENITNVDIPVSELKNRLEVNKEIFEPIDFHFDHLGNSIDFSFLSGVTIKHTFVYVLPKSEEISNVKIDFFYKSSDEPDGYLSRNIEEFVIEDIAPKYEQADGVSKGSYRGLDIAVKGVRFISVEEAREINPALISDYYPTPYALIDVEMVNHSNEDFEFMANIGYEDGSFVGMEMSEFGIEYQVDDYILNVEMIKAGESYSGKLFVEIEPGVLLENLYLSVPIADDNEWIMIKIS